MQITSTINHTGRRKIERKEVQILLDSREGEAPVFDARFNLEAGRWPENALVFVEAYKGNTLQRFSFGSVGAIKAPESRVLDKLDLSGSILFRVRIVDKEANLGRLVGSVDGLRPEGDGDEDARSSLLVIRTMPLGMQTWKIDFIEGEKPELCINNRIPFALNQLKENTLFQALILPAAFREILMYFLWNGEEEEGSVEEQWLQFAEYLARPRPSGDPKAMLEWIDEVSEAFAERFELADCLIRKLEEDVA